ncbi:MAG: helix-turn-helix domain-containing protein [Saprospiraceae bacterium]|nr:helix-turn-helix domain-containing protein [Saprospiraceae bacterium]
MSFIGQNIKKIRTVKKLSQQQMSDILGVSRASVGSYEEGRAEPKIDTIIRIANHFSITIDALLTREISVNDIVNLKMDHTSFLPELPDVKQEVKDMDQDLDILTLTARLAKVEEMLARLLDK